MEEQQEEATLLLAGVADALAEFELEPGVLGLVELPVGPGSGGPVQPPGFAVGQDAPLHAARRGLPELAQVILYLRAGTERAGAPVKIGSPGFRLGRRQWIMRNIAGAGESGASVVIREQYVVGRLAADWNGLLGQVAPAQRIQRRGG